MATHCAALLEAVEGNPCLLQRFCCGEAGGSRSNDAGPGQANIDWAGIQNRRGRVFGHTCSGRVPLAKVSVRFLYRLCFDHHELLTRLYLDQYEEVVEAMVARPSNPGSDLLTAASAVSRFAAWL
ncbi:hypothetical protein ACX80D_17535 [Arthrobacter sp. Sr24]